MGDPAQLLTVCETATTLRCSTKSVRRRIARGALVTYRVGNRILVDANSVTALLMGAQPVNEATVEDSEKKWRVYFEKGRGYAVKYYDAGGVRRTHRIPSDQHITTDEQAEAYAAAWYARNAGDPTRSERTVASPAPATPQPPAASRGRFVTFKDLGESWTSGKLAKRFPDHVPSKKSAKDDIGRLNKHVYPVIGGRAISDFEGPQGLELVEAVLENLPDDLSTATRRHVGQVIGRLLTLAVYPCRLLRANPLPKNFIPKAKQTRAKSFMYSDEDAKLMACADVPLVDRLYYGLMDREGFRVSEALSLTWRDIDLEHGIVALDKNKTDDPRSWTLDPGVAAALKIWRSITKGRATSLVLRGPDGSRPERIASARNLRAHLALAGVSRAQLFEDSETRMPLRAHDLRATFVTISLANGKTETFVTDRTGHRSSQMVAQYRRIARTAAEAQMGPLKPLAEAIPELREQRDAAQ